MSAFGGLVFTNAGLTLQSKAQTGVELRFTRIAVGDGDLGSSQIANLTALIHEIKSLEITKLEILTDHKTADIGCILSNQDIASGFYWKELGIFAQDPDMGEVLYCYGNSGALAEFIPAGGDADILEKDIDVNVITGNATSITATINSSLVYATADDLNNLKGEVESRIQVFVSPTEPGSMKTNDLWFQTL